MSVDGSFRPSSLIGWLARSDPKLLLLIAASTAKPNVHPSNPRVRIVDARLLTEREQGYFGHATAQHPI
jgi:hypothetical protein